MLTLLVRRYVWVVGGAVHGGENRGKEKARLRRGVSVLAATPGRLLDHLQVRACVCACVHRACVCVCGGG